LLGGREVNWQRRKIKVLSKEAAAKKEEAAAKKRARKRKDKRRTNFGMMEKAIAKFAFAIGQIQPIDDINSFESIVRALMLHLSANSHILKKYIMMGYSTRRTNARNAGLYEYIFNERRLNGERIYRGDGA
jgi:nitric oxide reductase activation protein